MIHKFAGPRNEGERKLGTTADKVSTLSITEQDKALDAAINRVYQKYGTDLSAFFRDVYRELQLERREPSSPDGSLR
jgi:hypothetical protein